MFKMIVYKITNLVNGKVYVGQTIRSLEDKWKQHLTLRNGCPKLIAAIKSYGVENFKIELIEKANKGKLLPNIKPVVAFNGTGSIYFISANKAKQYEFNPIMIGKIRDKNKTYKGYKWYSFNNFKEL